MLQRFIDDLRDSTRSAMRQTSLAAMAAISLSITIAFLCGAAFVAVLHQYGPVEACLAVAGIFFLIAVVAAGTYMVRKRQIEARAAARARATRHSLFSDPALLASGIQAARLIGIKRLVPVLAIGGLALGLLASRQQASDQTPAE
jgi:hypothetical protein